MLMAMGQGNSGTISKAVLRKDTLCSFKDHAFLALRTSAELRIGKEKCAAFNN